MKGLTRQPVKRDPGVTTSDALTHDQRTIKVWQQQTLGTSYKYDNFSVNFIFSAGMEEGC